MSPNSFSACVGALLEPCCRVPFYEVSRAKSSFLVPDLHKHVTFATLAHESVANSVRSESHLASLSCQIPPRWGLTANNTSVWPPSFTEV